MKSDTTTTFLNCTLAALLFFGVFFAYLSIMRTREFRRLSATATLAQGALVRAQGLASDAAAFNATAKSPELTRILQSVQNPTAAK